MMEYKPTILSGGESRSDDQIMAAHERKHVRPTGRASRSS